MSHRARREQQKSRRVDMSVMIDLAASAPTTGDGDETLEQKRKRLADLCRFIGGQLDPTLVASRPSPDVSDLSPRERETLDLLLRGDSEKQIAQKLRISPHTVHIYVKNLHRRFNVSSRGELLARWIAHKSV